MHHLKLSKKKKILRFGLHWICDTPGTEKEDARKLLKGEMCKISFLAERDDMIFVRYFCATCLFPFQWMSLSTIRPTPYITTTKAPRLSLREPFHHCVYSGVLIINIINININIITKPPSFPLSLSHTLSLSSYSEKHQSKPHRAASPRAISHKTV